MASEQLRSLTSEQISLIRGRWRKNASFLGHPDAERDAKQPGWFEHLLIQPDWFLSAISSPTTVVVARKGSGKSAVRLASIENRKSDAETLVIVASADELASLHAERLTKATARGYGAVSDWMQIFADLIVRHVARDMSGKVLLSDDDIAIRAWATTNGITERDFGERIVALVKTLVPWAKSLHSENSDQNKDSSERIARIAASTRFVLYVDDFDNLQEIGDMSTVRLIRDAIEAADRITHDNSDAEVHLFMRQDLWLNLSPGWHYADKVGGVVHLNWDSSDLKMWTQRRLNRAIGEALDIDPKMIRIPFDDMWEVFFPDEVKLRNGTTSRSFDYLVRRTMYTPRSLRQLIKLAIDGSDRLPVDQTVIEDAESAYSIDLLEFLKTEFGSLCSGLDICVQSFTGKPLEWIASDLYRHLKGLLGNGQVRLRAGVSHGDPETALARFLYRIGFLEVRYPQVDGSWEVRDVMRYPDHWKSVRADDAVRWAVRSAFYNGLKSHKDRKQPSARVNKRKTR